ncbi:MAG: C39 family peptidase [Planctomycetes bacterium]|jgi:hypothetical protein|nr:C39 family peptidase [Planctomycetota bacterium]
MPKKILLIIGVMLLAAAGFSIFREIRRNPGFSGQIYHASGTAMALPSAPAFPATGTAAGETVDVPALEPAVPAAAPAPLAEAAILNPDLAAKPAGPPVIEMPKPAASAEEYILLDVPFLSQAPFGDWQDQRQQDGCEEASVIMAMAWVRGTPLDKDGGLQEILALAKHQADVYGSYRDTSAADTESRIIRGYFNYQNSFVRENITFDDIKAELKKGRLIITPMNGQALGNPNFTAPGPERHMVVIKGYAPDKKEFITNDPGTRQGKSYRYEENLFYAAIRDYPTGDHEPIREIKKTMIVIEK